MELPKTLQELKTLSEQMNSAIERSHYVRGKIISELILLERLVDDYICRYATEDIEKQKFLKDVIFSTEKISFENKRLILEQILKANKNNFLKENSTFINDISYLIAKRNNVAHLLLDITNGKYKKEGITLQKHKNVSTEIVLTELDIDGIQKKISTCQQLLIDLIKSEYGYDYDGAFREVLKSTNLTAFYYNK